MTPPTHTPALPCTRCGYDLVGLDAAAPCPECAITEAGKRAARMLLTAEPRRVRALSESIQLLGWIHIGFLVSFGSLYFLDGVMSGGNGSWQGAVLPLAFAGMMLAIVALYFLYIVSACFFARRMPLRGQRRPVLAWCIVGSAIMGAIFALLYVFEGFGVDPWLNHGSYLWSSCLALLAFVLLLQVLPPVSITIGLATCARTAGKVALSRVLTWIVALQCGGMVIGLVGQYVSMQTMIPPGGRLTARAQAIRSYAIWVEDAWPWFNLFCVMLVGVGALVLAHAYAKQAAQMFASVQPRELSAVPPC